MVYEKSNEGEMWVVDRDRTITIENDDAKQFVYPDLRSSLAEQPLSKLIERLTPDSAEDLQNRLDDLFGDIQVSPNPNPDRNTRNDRRLFLFWAFPSPSSRSAARSTSSGSAGAACSISSMPVTSSLRALRW